MCFELQHTFVNINMLTKEIKLLENMSSLNYNMSHTVSTFCNAVPYEFLIGCSNVCSYK